MPSDWAKVWRVQYFVALADGCAAPLCLLLILLLLTENANGPTLLCWIWEQPNQGLKIIIVIFDKPCWLTIGEITIIIITGLVFTNLVLFSLSQNWIWVRCSITFILPSQPFFWYRSIDVILLKFCNPKTNTSVIYFCQHLRIFLSSRQTWIRANLLQKLKLRLWKVFSSELLSTKLNFVNTSNILIVRPGSARQRVERNSVEVVLRKELPETCLQHSYVLGACAAVPLLVDQQQEHKVRFELVKTHQHSLYRGIAEILWGGWLRSLDKSIHGNCITRMFHSFL